MSSAASVRSSARCGAITTFSGHHGEAVKHIKHPTLGPLAIEYSAFAVDGRTDLTMVVYNPATPEDAERIKSLLP